MQESDPIILFSRWFEEAKKLSIDKPNAMVLSTVDIKQQPSSRVVLLSSFDEHGFVFHTNYNSRKGKELVDNPQACLLFWWDELNYQIRIEGEIEKTTSHASDIYFSNRPRGSQIGAWASDQSTVIVDRAVLDNKAKDWEEKFAGKEVTRPPHWGGYRLVPASMEFWIGKANRLHDRFLYSRLDNKRWTIDRLSP